MSTSSAPTSASPNQATDPYAWSLWAAQQNPGQYNLSNSGINSNNLYQYQQLLQNANLWNPAWNDYANAQSDAAGAAASENGSTAALPPAPDLSSLAGYTVDQTQGPGYDIFDTLKDSSGNSLGDLMSQGAQGSLHGSDYATMAAIAGTVLGGGAALSGLGGATAGTGSLVGQGANDAYAAMDAAYSGMGAGTGANAGIGSLAAGTGAGSAVLTPAETAALASSVAPSSDAALLAASGTGTGTAAEAATDAAITDAASGEPVTQFVTTAAPATTAGTSGLGYLAAGTAAGSALLNAGQTADLANSVSGPSSTDLSNIANQAINTSGANSSLLSQLGTWAAQNPTTAIKLAGLLGGGLASLLGKGSSSSSSSNSAINNLSNSQSNLIANSKGALNAIYNQPRQVTAPPAGYQGAEDPRGQWDWFNQANNARFFNGIGGLSPTASTGSNPTSGTGQ